MAYKSEEVKIFNWTHCHPGEKSVLLLRKKEYWLKQLAVPTTLFQGALAHYWNTTPGRQHCAMFICFKWENLFNLSLIDTVYFSKWPKLSFFLLLIFKELADKNVTSRNFSKTTAQLWKGTCIEKFIKE